MFPKSPSSEMRGGPKKRNSDVCERQDIFSQPPISLENSKYFCNLRRAIENAEEMVRKRPNSPTQKRNLAYLKEIEEKTPEEKIEHLLTGIKKSVRNAITDVGDSEGAFAHDRVKSRCADFCHLAKEELSSGPPFVEVVEDSLPTPIDGEEYRPYHVYLRASVAGKGEVIIDPTIAQYVKDYNDVFVGTREELKAIVLDANTDLISGAGFYLDKGRLKYFKKIWGEASIPVSEEGQRQFSSF